MGNRGRRGEYYNKILKSKNDTKKLMSYCIEIKMGVLKTIENNGLRT